MAGTMVDVFAGDPFTTLSLTAAINKAKYVPSRIATLGLFNEEGISTTSVVIEERAGELSLVQTTPRGAPASQLVENPRAARTFLARHLQRESTILPDQVQNVRAFGSADQGEAVQTVITRRQEKLRQMLEATLEWHRAGAIKGLIVDADNATLVNLFTEFGVAQQTATITENEVRENAVAILRLIDSELGATPASGYRAFCGDDFFDALTAMADVKASFQNQEGVVNRMDLRAGFTYGGITWENYRGNVSGTPYFATGEAYVFPEGTDIFQMWFAPGDFMEAVNTIGLPLYSKLAIDPQFQRFATLHAQSNPLAMCLRPRAVIKVTID